jgi:transposase-like protein
MQYYVCPFCKNQTLCLKNNSYIVGHGMTETAKEYNCFNCGFTLGIKKLGNISEKDADKLQNFYNLITQLKEI